MHVVVTICKFSLFPVEKPEDLGDFRILAGNMDKKDLGKKILSVKVFLAGNTDENAILGKKNRK